MIKRSLTKKMLQAAKKFPVVTITGPRQSGKTTLVRAEFKDCDYVSLELPDQRAFALEDPRGFLTQFNRPLILDEVQRAPELFSYIQEVESEGYDATTFRVDLHARFALPVLTVIVCIIGIGIAVKRKGREGPSVSIALGALMVFFYWVLHSFCLSLGYGGLLPPVVAAWISNIIFSCYAVFNLLSAE